MGAQAGVISWAQVLFYFIFILTSLCQSTQKWVGSSDTPRGSLEHRQWCLQLRPRIILFILVYFILFYFILIYFILIISSEHSDMSWDGRRVHRLMGVQTAGNHWCQVRFGLYVSRYLKLRGVALGFSRYVQSTMGYVSVMLNRKTVLTHTVCVCCECGGGR